MKKSTNSFSTIPRLTPRPLAVDSLRISPRAKGKILGHVRGSTNDVFKNLAAPAKRSNREGPPKLLLAFVLFFAIIGLLGFFSAGILFLYFLAIVLNLS